MKTTFRRFVARTAMALVLVALELQLLSWLISSVEELPSARADQLHKERLRHRPA